MIDGNTRVFAILGDPVAHSLSPTMHNAAFQALGLPAAYVPLRCSERDLPTIMAALTRSGGGGNVTVPHKEAAARSVDRCLEQAELLGACNTFWSDDGESVGENTDVAGITAALDQLDAPAGGWLIVGTGGGARAAVGAARIRGVPVAARSRSVERRERFLAWARDLGVVEAPVDACTVVINTTPLGLVSRATTSAGEATSRRSRRSRYGVRQRRDRVGAGDASRGAPCVGRSGHARGPGRRRVSVLVSARSRLR